MNVRQVKKVAWAPVTASIFAALACGSSAPSASSTDAGGAARADAAGEASPDGSFPVDARSPTGDSGVSDAECRGAACNDGGGRASDATGTPTGGDGGALQCLYNGELYSDGDWFPEANGCDMCGCRGGNVGCPTAFCTTARPTSGSNCTYVTPSGAMTYPAGATWTCNCGAVCICAGGEPLVVCDGG